MESDAGVKLEVKMVLEPSKARGEAVVVPNHDGWIENHHRVCVHPALRLKVESKILRSCLARSCYLVGETGT